MGTGYIDITKLDKILEAQAKLAASINFEDAEFKSVVGAEGVGIKVSNEIDEYNTISALIEISSEGYYKGELEFETKMKGHSVSTTIGMETTMNRNPILEFEAVYPKEIVEKEEKNYNKVYINEVYSNEEAVGALALLGGAVLTIICMLAGGVPVSAIY